MNSMTGQQDLQEIQPTQNGTAVIFVHGILSSSEQCWRNGTVYWPELLKQESDLAETGIYTFSYQTGIFSGNYSLGDAMDSLKEHLDLDGLLKHKQLIFVAHSMGGIVVREFLVRRQSDLKAENIQIGLFLLASPSLGSDYANWITGLAKLLGIKNAQGNALRFEQNNTWLNDLDKNFQNLKESDHLSIQGKELIESDAMVFRKFLRKQIVEPFSGARYFGEAVKIPLSNHTTITKPKNTQAFQHRLLHKFITELIASPENAQADQVSPTTVHAKSGTTTPIDSPQPLAEEIDCQSSIIYDLVKSRIQPLLNAEPLLEVSLRSVLNDPEDCIAELCNQAQRNAKKAMGQLTQATRKTMEQIQARRQSGIVQVHTNAHTAQIWLSLFAVDPKWLCQHSDVFTKDKSVVPISIAADSVFSADLGVSALQKKRPARPKIVAPFEVDIPDILNMDTLLETGPGKMARLDEIKQALWTLAIPIPETGDAALKARYRPPITFGSGPNTPENQQLNGEIVALRTAGSRDHYCVITSVAMDSSEFDQVFMQQLLHDLPDLRIMVYRSQDVSVLLVLETEIISCFRAMNDLIKEYDAS